MEAKKTLECICKKQGCWRGADRSIPDYCQGNNYLGEIEKSKNKYNTPDAMGIYEAACIVGAKNDGFRPRIEEALDFANRLHLSRIGFATCNAFAYEQELIRKLFTEEGFEVACAACQIGRVTPEHRGTPHLKNHVNATCNPIAQAEILNSKDTELNFIIGLCLGHDILFTLHSKAPVSTLIVKDRMTGNNPAAALYGYHARRSLFNIGRKEDKLV